MTMLAGAREWVSWKGHEYQPVARIPKDESVWEAAVIVRFHTGPNVIDMKPDFLKQRFSSEERFLIPSFIEN